MKKAIFILVALLSATASGQSKGDALLVELNGLDESLDILFTAPWCGPCQKAQKENPNAFLVNVDDASPELLKRYDVARIPKLIKGVK